MKLRAINPKITPLSPCSLGLRRQNSNFTQLKALPPTNVFEAFHEKLVGACDEPAELINILKPIKKSKPPKSDKGIHFNLLLLTALIFLSCASTHNALGDDEDVGNAKDDKGKRGDVDSEEAANLRREQPYISFRSFW